jgi:hypothetical protein
MALSVRRWRRRPCLMADRIYLKITAPARPA